MSALGENIYTNGEEIYLDYDDEQNDTMGNITKMMGNKALMDYYKTDY